MVVESHIVKAGLVVYGVSVIVVICILWRNAAAPDSLKTISIAIATILPVIICTLPYLNRETLHQEYNYVLFFDNKTKEVVFGDTPNVYHSTYLYMTTNLGPVLPEALVVNEFGDLMGTPGLDLIEKGILEKLLQVFTYNWDIEQKEHRGPRSVSKFSTRASAIPSTIVKQKELLARFSHNKLITGPGVIVMPQIALPSKCTMTIMPSDKAREIVFSNSYVDLTISVRSPGGGVVQNGVEGVLPADPNDMNRYYVVNYLVNVSMKIRRGRSHSPEMKSYRRWFTNVCGELSDYDWEVVEKKIEKNLQRKAVSKILEK